MKYETLLVEKTDRITTVTFNQPEKLNPLSPRFLVEFSHALDNIKADVSCRFVIFTGAGKAFSCGAALSQEAIEDRMTWQGLTSDRQWQAFCQKIMSDMENLEQVTFGAVNGVAVGGAVCLLLNCDFRVASESAKFIIPETNLGMPLSWGATPRLVALLGPAKTKELIMTCDMIDAQEAFRIGLVNRVVPADNLINACHEMLDKIARKGPLAIRICKKQVNAASVARMSDLYLFEADLMDLCMLAGDTVEGVVSFMEKRAPDFPSAKEVARPARK